MPGFWLFNMKIVHSKINTFSWVAVHSKINTFSWVADKTSKVNILWLFSYILYALPITYDYEVLYVTKYWRGKILANLANWNTFARI